jgi:hypothetical protein
MVLATGEEQRYICTWLKSRLAMGSGRPSSTWSSSVINLALMSRRAPAGVAAMILRKPTATGTAPWYGTLVPRARSLWSAKVSLLWVSDVGDGSSSSPHMTVSLAATDITLIFVCIIIVLRPGRGDD